LATSSKSLHPPRFKGLLSMNCPRGACGRDLTYQRAAAVACPILLLFAHRCGISAERSATFRLNYYLIENLEIGEDL
jgi:hypothetical protein